MEELTMSLTGGAALAPTRPRGAAGPLLADSWATEASGKRVRGLKLFDAASVGRLARAPEARFLHIVATAAPRRVRGAEARMKAQDDQLARLGEGVDRIRGLGQNMQEETKTQLGLLDQLESDVDKTTLGIREETKHAEQITVSGQTFYMYVCIAILVLVMVLELIIGLQ
ncbi:hypothetical protein JL722_2492 [Aureococcus anophagefferens]|nr:hypothetical protein JL722_2492 [Aureococcus anophagefferens]